MDVIRERVSKRYNSLKKFGEGNVSRTTSYLDHTGCAKEDLRGEKETPGSRKRDAAFEGGRRS